MHLQENTLFDRYLQVKVICNVAQCPLHYVTYAPTEFEGFRVVSAMCRFRHESFQPLVVLAGSFRPGSFRPDFMAWTIFWGSEK